MISRRHLVKTGSATAAAMSLRQAFGAAPVTIKSPNNTASPHFFVFAQMVGAWDIGLAWDPKDRTQRLSDGSRAFDQPYDFDEVKTFGRIPLAPVGQILGRFHDRMTIINGIDMELDNGHIPTMIMTGQGNGSDQPSIQALAASYHPFIKTTMIPHIYTSYDGFFRGGALSGTTIIIDPMGAFEVLVKAGDAASLRRVAEATESVAQGYHRSARSKLRQFASAQSGAADLKDRMDAVKVPAPTDPSSMGMFFGTLFREGVCGSMTWSFDDLSFDTHSDHDENHPLATALERISDFANSLATIGLDEHTSVLDRTTFVLCSEFCRTPRLNSSLGKDHNFRTNSIVMFGHKLNSAVYGQSGERAVDGGYLEAHCAQPIDFATGRPKLDGTILHARNVWAGSSRVLGFNMADKFDRNIKPVTFL